MSKQQYALIIGADQAYLGCCLHFLADLKEPFELHIYGVEQMSLEQRQCLQATLCFGLWKQASFALTEKFHVSWHETWPEDLSPFTQWLLVPETLTRDVHGAEGDLELVFNEAQLDFIETQEAHGHTLEEGLFNTVLAYEPLELMSPADLNQWLHQSAEAWLAREDQPQAVDLSLYHALQSAEIWRIGWSKDYRIPLEQALHKLMLTPEDLFSHLVASLYKRYYAVGQLALAETTCHILQAWKAEQEITVQILPPPASQTVTYLVITYNRLGMLKRNLEGILNQSSDDWKVMILNHGSTDGTQAYCEQLLAQEPDKVKLIHKSANLGVGVIWELAEEMLNQLETELFCFVSDDDWVLPQHLEKMQAAYTRHPWAAMAYASYQLVDLNEKATLHFGPLYAQACITQAEIELERLLVTGICPQSGVYRKEPLYLLLAHDPYAPPGAEYGLHDFLASIWTQAQFEVSYTPELLSCITSNENSAFATQELGELWLHVMRAVVSNYTGLFGPERYPRPLLENYFEFVLKTNLNTLYQGLHQLQNPEAYALMLEKKMAYFSAAYAFKMEVLSQKLAESAVYFQAGVNPYAAVNT